MYLRLRICVQLSEEFLQVLQTMQAAERRYSASLMCFLYMFSVMLVTPSDIAIWTVNIYIYIYIYIHISIILYWIACSPRYPGFHDLRRRYPLPQQLSSQNEGSAEMLPRFSNFCALV